MKCPKCKSSDLFPVKLEPGLPAMGCKSCEGVSISLLYYRDWADRDFSRDVVDVAVSDMVEDNDTQAALSCSKCSRLMTKYRISGQQKNRLDVCSSCDEAWIDNGEWELMKALGLIDKLPAIFTVPWQIRIKQQISENSRYERLEKLVGEMDAQKAREIREWLNGKKHKPSIVQYFGYE